MIKTASLLALAITALADMPAHAQQRVFVASFGSDSNSCIVTSPCRTFQHAHDTAPANSEIEVVDPAGYGPLTITKGISIQGHGFAGIFQGNGALGSAAITVSVTTSDPVSLNGLLIEGGGTGYFGILVNSAAAVQILNSVVRHFNQTGIFIGNSTTNLLIEDTIASDNGTAGITPNQSGGTAKATLNRITANNNLYGVVTFGHTTIANSIISNNHTYGLVVNDVIWLAKTLISGNGTGVAFGGTNPIANSYGDNYLADNTTPMSGGSFTPVSMQ